MSSRYILPPVLILVAAVATCAGPFGSGTKSGSERAYVFSRFAMDTVVDYTIMATSRQDGFTAMLAAHEEVERIERLLWEKNSESAVHALNRGQRRIDREVDDFLERLRGYHHDTGGRFDPAIGHVIDLYGFETDRPRIPDAVVLQDAVARAGLANFPQDSGATLAVGGVAKGYAVDRAIEVLRRHGIRNALVNAGGDLFALGSNGGRPWMIGVAHPGRPDVLIDTLYVQDAAVATSGDYERFFERNGVRYHHILDPATGRPARSVRSATVVARTTEQADALATGLFVAGAAVGADLIDSSSGASGMVIHPSFEATYFAGFEYYTTAPDGPMRASRAR